ncbi:DsbA family oxidoreductase [Rhodovastum atsumiense]|uniref:DsbA family oxidoreductase n=1 Tax=Rhodovastum atsumiense TaxID=504468 RepID=A0A5M6IKK7_9PROT|nr:DsbA family oxidoreductase [Rhodovastum atsumiense]KAA5608793.1 DsbA family oxidoreductase [Rhodovastum atsumiense]CAH2600876.1 DsbA family oxidoreductase [Rhodovastum atsumiense]
MAATGRIDVISDVTCPWCYIGKRQLERALPLLAAQGLVFSVQWHPFQINPEIGEAGMDRRDHRIAKFGSWARSQEAEARAAEAGAAVGLDFRFDLIRRTPNTIAAHRVIWQAGREGVQDVVVEALFRAFFTQGQDIGDAATLARIAGSAGLDPEAVGALLSGPAGRAEVLAEDQAARAAGLDGVPGFVMSNYVLFSGAVPAATMAEAFARAHEVISRQSTPSPA